MKKSIPVNHAARAAVRRQARISILAGNAPAASAFVFAATSNREDSMTFAGRLSVVTAYAALAFVGAIVLGVV